MHINFTASGLYALENMLRGPADRSDDLSPVFNVIADDMMEHVERVFETEGGNVGRPWQVLDDNTIAQKKGGGDTLRDSDRLFGSVTRRGHEDMVLEITDTFLRFGTEVPYADFIQRGTRRMPARPFLVFSMRESQKYFKMVSGYIFNSKVERLTRQGVPNNFPRGGDDFNAGRF